MICFITKENWNICNYIIPIRSGPLIHLLICHQLIHRPISIEWTIASLDTSSFAGRKSAPTCGATTPITGLPSPLSVACSASASSSYGCGHRATVTQAVIIGSRGHQEPIVISKICVPSSLSGVVGRRHLKPRVALGSMEADNWRGWRHGASHRHQPHVPPSPAHRSTAPRSRGDHHLCWCACTRAKDVAPGGEPPPPPSLAGAGAVPASPCP
jgi:hypothetical protein